MTVKQEQLINGSASTTLGSSIISTATTLTVGSGTGFPSDGNFRVRIDDEIVLVTAVSGTTWTISRGSDGTTPGNHSSAAPVKFYLTGGTFDGLQNDMYQVGSFVNRPTTAKVGAIYAPIDSQFICRWNGSSWDCFGETHWIVPPPNNFGTMFGTWYNQGSATFVQQGFSWVLSTPGESAGPVRAVTALVPTIPYVIEVGFRFLGAPVNFFNMGFFWRDSSGGKYLNNGIAFNGQTKLFAGKFNADDSFNSSYAFIDQGAGAVPPPYNVLNYPEFFRFLDTGTNRGIQFSQNRRDWLNFPVSSPISNTDYITPDTFGFGVSSGNSQDLHMEIFHYILNP